MVSATAVPRGFYRRFAEYAQQQGINVISTDYRGIGDSKRGSLRGFEMEYADWSSYDLAAAVDHALARGKVWLSSDIASAATPSASCDRTSCRRPTSARRCRLARLDATPRTLSAWARNGMGDR